jgi:acetyl-CoA carboxylase carboxyl transferase subunit beta
MKKWWFNSMLFNRGLEYRCGLSKTINSFGPIENNSINEDPSILTDMDNNIHSWKNNNDNSSYNHDDYLADVLNSDSIYFDIEKPILESGNNHSLLNELESFLSSSINSSFLQNGSKSNHHNSMYDTKSNWNSNGNCCIESYLDLDSPICIYSYIESSLDSPICIDTSI